MERSATAVGRRGRSRTPQQGHVVAGTASQLRRALPPIEPWPTGRVEAVHEAALRLLEDAGIEFLGAGARDRWRQAGAAVDPETMVVRIPRELVADALAKAQNAYLLHARNPERTLQIGGDAVAFGLVSGPPTVQDAVRGRRPGNLADYRELVRLAQCFPIVNYLGNQPVPPTELPAESRHLDACLANIVEGDKPWGCSAIGRERAQDSVEMAAIARGLTLDQALGAPGCSTVINANSPRRYDGPMGEGLMAMAELGHPVVVTPFTLMGAMAPVSLTAALIQQHAEALAGLTLVQLTRAGSPMAYGAFTSNVDLKSGAPAFGTPENVKATLIAGQLARHVGLPYRASNASASVALDAQAAYESLFSLFAAVMGGANMVYHAVGWMEGGLVASFEKIVLDCELVQGIAEIVAGGEEEDVEQALAQILETPAGGHFFGTETTMARYQRAFYLPILSDWRNFQQWTAAGAPDAAARATRIWQERLAGFEPPPLDPAILEALEAFVARRKAEIARGIGRPA
ncbi:trimethylamine methyltransferase family protein [Geminicoccus roseus]|uniref:trimethylamine methyltransferase family protein n=1 Tax=Geminicoccus roseus TaxID=404900 RepID=UPI000485DE6C|nr:trimethylamine methyltransferase family protein [Geminicoccus roseus]